MREFRTLKKLMLIIFAIMIVLFIIDTIYMDFNTKKKSLNEKYEGIISEIYLTENMNTPKFKINRQWVYLGLKNHHYDFIVKVGDSIVKKQGKAEIDVYRRGLAGEWGRLVFE